MTIREKAGSFLLLQSTVLGVSWLLYIQCIIMYIDSHFIGKYDPTYVQHADFTAAAVWRNYQLFIEPLLRQGDRADYDLFVSGGGAKNMAIMRCMRVINANDLLSSMK